MRPRIRTRQAVVDPALKAVLSELVPLRYTQAPAAAEDVPLHVRAASAVRRRGSRLLIVQDDVSALALHDAQSGTRALLLPMGADGRRTFGEDRGNKHAKMDLEACAALPDGRLVAFGSGSTPAREAIVVLDERSAPRIVDGAALYAMLRATPELAGSELNLEGAVVMGDALRLVQRGNGAPARGLLPVDATADIPLEAFLGWLDGGGRVPDVRDIVQYDLGRVGDVELGAAFGLTDAAPLPDGRMALLACAEASPDTYRDGEVQGCRFGVCDGTEVRVADIEDPGGRRTTLKLEGLELREPGDPLVFDVVADVDRVDEPARLGRLDVRGA